ncbi:phage tail tube protein [Parvibaculum sp.]|uniref:phage tail tube protein n=1 Tax=Parvibaculum sp. TaxID=2024848 RepID=UPI002622661E|nr:phage tail tube protein [Parvibaculum sp.]MCW5727250.1 hypothetical protein [Parvibaculum sp.]
MTGQTFSWDLESFIGVESAFGAAASSGAYRPIPFYTHGLARNQTLEDDPLLGHGAGRAPHPSVESLPDHGGPMAVPFDLGNLGIYLRAAMGVPVTTEDVEPEGEVPGDYTHVFKSRGLLLPSHTLVIKRRADLFARHTGLMLNGLSGAVAREGGYRRLNLDWKGATETTETASGTGSLLDALTVDRLMGFKGQIRKDGSAMASVTAASWNFMNNLEAFDAPDQAHAGGYDPGHPAFTGELTARTTAAGDALYALADAGTPFVLELLWSLAANRQIALRSGVTRLEPTARPVNGPGGQQLQFRFKAEPDPGEADSAFLVATLKNHVASYGLS